MMKHFQIQVFCKLRAPEGRPNAKHVYRLTETYENISFCDLWRPKGIETLENKPFGRFEVPGGHRNARTELVFADLGAPG